jgi:hypothetical protein
MQQEDFKSFDQKRDMTQIFLNHCAYCTENELNVAKNEY